jgi:acyl carrier protein
MNDKIVARITPVFREVFEKPDLELTAELSAADIENWDSLNHITLIVELETFTGITLTTDELVGLRNVGDFVELLEQRGYCG